MLRWLLQHLLRSFAQKKVAEAFSSASSRDVSNPPEALPPGEPDETFGLAVLFSTHAEAAALIDRLTGKISTRAANCPLVTGQLPNGPVVVAIAQSGKGEPDAKQAAQVTDAILRAHHPRLVVSAGFALGLGDSCARGDLLIANQIMDPQGGRVTIEVARESGDPHRLGRLLTVARLPKTAPAKRALGEEFEADAAERISFAVADVCRREQLPMMAVHVVTEGVEDQPPPDVEHLQKQKSLAGQTGAMLGNLFRRPSSAQDLWNLQQTTWQASDRLAQFLIELPVP